MSILDTISTVLVPAQNYDLTDLATVKDELSLKASDITNDVWLGRAITQVSATIAQWCNRTFPVETVQDQIYPTRGPYAYAAPGAISPLNLTRYPLLAPPIALATNADTASGAVLPFASTAGVVVGQPVGHESIPTGTVVKAMDSGSVTLSKPIAADVPAGAAVFFGLDVAVTWQQLGEHGRRLVAGVDYQIDARIGALGRIGRDGFPLPWRAMPTTVTYQTGFATIPADLVEAALRQITARFTARGRDPLLRVIDQPNLGRREYWVGTAPNVRGGFTEEIADVLDQYRVPVAV